MKNLRGMLRAVLIVGAVSVVVGAGFAVRSYLQAKNAGPELNAFSSKPVVEITSPAAEDEFEVGEAINVEVYSISQTALITSIELQIDGVLAEVQAATGSGRSPFNTTFSFAASEPGSHNLLAKAVDNLGFESYSVPVQIDITENEGAEQAPFYSGSGGPIVLSSGQSLPAPPPSPPPPDPGNALSPADSWTISVGNWLSPPDSNQPLSSPAIGAHVEKCSVSLWIEDFTEHEQGFVVFRQVEFIPGWVKIATLSPMPGGLKGFTDENPPAGPANISYYVEAFNKYHSAASNVEQVTIPADPDCASLYDGPPGFTVEMDSLTINQPVESAYCYRSFDKVSWHRWPASGFFTPGEDGQIETHESPLLFFTEDFNGEPLNTEISISLDCWGWLGGALIPLGDFTGILNPDITETQFVGTGDFTSQVLTVPNFKPFETEYSAATLPLYTVGLTFDPNTCKQHIVPAQTPEYFKTCTIPYPLYHLGPDGLAPQGYLVWDIHDLECQAGSGYLHCIPWVEWLKWLLKFQFAGYEDRVMSWWINDTHGPSAEITNPLQMAYAIPPPDRACTGLRTLTLNLYVDTVTTVVGPKVSINIPCEMLEPMEAKSFYEVQLRFDNLVLDNIHDSVNDHDLEFYGKITIMLQCFNQPDTECTNGLATKGGANGYFIVDSFLIGSEYGPVTLGNGVYPFSDLPLFNETLTANVSPTFTLRIDTSRPRRLLIFPFLFDSDSGWYNSPDQVCVGGIEVGPESTADNDWWPQRDNFHIGLVDSNGSADCTFDAYLTTIK